MIEINDPKECCGCTACEAICPKDAITMVPDALGFKYPEVDLDKCIDCHLCEKVCAFHPDYDKSLNLAQPEVYGARHKDMAEVATSRSGAAFIALSDYILEQGGVVYGAGYKDHFRVAHKRATTRGERDEFKGSKYVQSDLEGVFRQVKADLKAGLTVMFSGTPCQTAGLHSYVGKKLRENLYLVDIVCHGVPGPYVWRDYLDYLEHKEGTSVTAVDFRDKAHFGWTAHKESFLFGSKFKPADSYTYLFYEHIMFRHSCEVCPFTNLQRPSDLTLADFWGWQFRLPGFNSDDKGISLLLVNTVKGVDLLDKVRFRLDLRPTELNIEYNPNLNRPSVIHRKRMQFEEEYVAKGFPYILQKYGNVSFKYHLETKVRWMIGKGKGAVRKILRIFKHGC